MKQYQKLLLRREARELTGHKGGHFWLLVLMLVATFASIAFSEGSQKYLKYRMADPFTNWVSIARNNDDASVDNETFSAFRDSLFLDENKARYDYRDVLNSMSWSVTMGIPNGRSWFLSGRYFEHLNTPLFRQVLSEENLAEGCRVDTTLLTDDAMGVIITVKVAENFGFDLQHLPPYLFYWSYNSGADSLGLKVVDEHFVPVALPVLAVVKRLPNNVQLLANNFLYEQLRGGDMAVPFDFAAHRDDYMRQLVFFVAEGQEEAFNKTVTAAVPDSLKATMRLAEAGDDYHQMRSSAAGTLMQVDVGDAQTPFHVHRHIAETIEQHFADPTQVCQVYRLVTQAVESPRSMFLSIEFNTLRKIHEFETFAQRHHIQMELEQVRTMENFVAVTHMAAILSGAMVIFSIVCIIMYMVNMLQGYFQKVRRNIGTFKAFGMDGRELINAYVLLLISIVGCTVGFALLLTWCLQGLMAMTGMGKDGFNYLSLWNGTTYTAIAVIFISTICTVVVVMVRLLNKTPGDLIYDRD